MGASNEIDSVDVVDDYTVRFNLNRPDGTLFDSLTSRLAMLPPAYFEEVGRFELWLRHTEVMPANMEKRYDVALEGLRPLAEEALQALVGTTDLLVPPDPEDPWESFRP